MAGGGGDRQAGGQDGGRQVYRYNRDFSVRMDVGDISKVKARDVITAISECSGMESILACVPKSGNIFEITLRDKESVKIVTPELCVGDKIYQCTEVVQDEIVVSFLHLPAYVNDGQIEQKLLNLNIEIVGEIKRRKYPGTNIADGTRYVKVRFPPDLKSLPYSMKFFDGEISSYYRVMHNDQVKVCNRCLGDDHIFKNCPENTCFKCGFEGHLSRFCVTEACATCHRFGVKCICVSEEEREEYFCTKCNRGSNRCRCDLLCPTCGLVNCSCEDHSDDNSGEHTDEVFTCSKCGSSADCECEYSTDEQEFESDNESEKSVSHGSLECSASSEQAITDGTTNSVDVASHESGQATPDPEVMDCDDESRVGAVTNRQTIDRPTSETDHSGQGASGTNHEQALPVESSDHGSLDVSRSASVQADVPKLSKREEKKRRNMLVTQPNVNNPKIRKVITKKNKTVVSNV